MLRTGFGGGRWLARGAPAASVRGVESWLNAAGVEGTGASWESIIRYW